MQSQLVLGTLDRITGIDDLAINEIVTNQPTRHGKKSTRYKLMTLTHIPYVSFISQLLVGAKLVGSESTS